MGLCPIAPPKGFPFSIVCFCHRQQQPKTPLETFGRKYFFFSFSLKYRVYPLDNLRLFYLFCLSYPICVMSFCSLFRIRFSSLEI